MSPEALVHPEWLGALAALWLAAALAVGAARHLARARGRRLLGSAAPRPGALRDAALLAALAALGVALLGPRIGWRSVLVPSRGVDLVLLVDVSRSMDAQDTPPSRLARARRLGVALLAGLAPDDRAALAAFGGRGVLLTPLTPDRDALAELVLALESDLVLPRGSDLGDGVRRALAAFEPGSGRARVLFVLSDGEDPDRRSDLAVAEAMRADVRVHAAALGSEEGASIPDHGVPLRDATGAIVVSRRRAERLERLTQATGGALLRADAWGEIDLAAALVAVHADAGTGMEDGALVARRVRAVRSAPFAALAFVLLAAEAIGRQRRPARAAAAAAGLAGAALLAGAAPPGPSTPGAVAAPPAPAATSAVAGVEARLVERPRDAALLLRLGLARLERGSTDEAARAFTAAALSARDPNLAALAYYDLGVAYLERGEFANARDAFFDALALAPGDREARFDLEWALRALASQSSPPAPEPDPEPKEREDARPERPDESAEQEANAEPGEPELDPADLQRWQDRVKDDLTHALRSAAREGAPTSREPGPGW